MKVEGGYYLGKGTSEGRERRQKKIMEGDEYDQSIHV
jgi:hypothetical protein